MLPPPLLEEDELLTADGSVEAKLPTHALLEGVIVTVAEDPLPVRPSCDVEPHESLVTNCPCSPEATNACPELSVIVIDEPGNKVNATVVAVTAID